MIRITLYGTGCRRQQLMLQKVREILNSLSLEAEIVEVQDIETLLIRRISRTPALEINGRLCISGRIPFRAELVELLRQAERDAAETIPSVMKVSARNERYHDYLYKAALGLDQVKPTAMKTPVTWIVGMDFSSMDQAVVEYTASLANLLNPDKIYFLHIYPDLELPEAAKAALSDTGQPLDERLAAQMMEFVLREFPDAGRYQAECQVVEGKPESQLLRWAHIKSAELLLMGRKKKAGGNGVVPRRVARKAECSVLFVPENPSFQMRTFLVPTDFSEPSAMALDTARWLGEQVEGAEVFLYHACHLPSSIYYDGLAGSNMVDLLREAAEEQMDEFKSRHNAEESRVIVNARADRSVAKTVVETAADIPADLILIGGKGRSGITGVLLGSVTESLIQAEEDLPVWVVKQTHRKTANRDFAPAEQKSDEQTRA